MKKPQQTHPIDAKVARRLAWLEELIDREYESSPKTFEDRTGIKMAQVSQWFSGYRALRDKALARLEEAAGKPAGYFDRERDEIMIGGSPGPDEGDEIVIRQYGAGGSMGSGVVLRDQPGVIRSWRVSPEWVQKNVRNATSASNLAIVTGFGDSMRPMFNPGDPLLIDTGVTTVDFDGIYFFAVDGEGFIKRLQRVPGEGMVAISENKAYRDWTIKPTMEFIVFGRVLRVWRGDDY